MKTSRIAIVGAALSLALAWTPALAATDLTLSPTVSAALAAATTPEDVAALVLANPGFEATIIATALATGGFLVEDIVDAALVADPSAITAVVSGATEAAPESASDIAFTAANAVGMSLGEDGDETDAALAEEIGRAIVRGLEAALGAEATRTAELVRAAMAELFPFLGEDRLYALAEAIANETTVASDTAESLINDIQTAALGNEFGGEELLNQGNQTNNSPNSSAE